jgi:exonuclease III
VYLFFMLIRILSWNVRFLIKRSVVKNLLRDWKCDMVCLQETKLFAIDLGVFEACGVILILIGWL